MSDAEPPAVLASDAEREHTTNVLREAAVEGRLTLDEFSQRVERALAARTRNELEAVTADLPVPATPTVPAPVTASARPGPVARVTGAVRWSVAILSGVVRKGRWRLDAESWAVAILGGCVIDLRGAVISAPVSTINVFTFWGGVEVIVPEGVEVEVNNDIPIMGGMTVKLSGPPPGPGAPVIRINAVNIMAGTSVRDSPDGDRDQAPPQLTPDPSARAQLKAERRRYKEARRRLRGR
jgi:uncharacterized protein DUF1707